MADYIQPDYVDRRVRYFNNQFLLDQDLIDEQKYYLDRQRRLVRHLYTPGIVEGLDVTIDDADTGKIAIAKGTAIDSLGQQIVLAENTTLTLTDAANTLLVISYYEQPADEAAAGSKQSSRWHENPSLALVAAGATDVGTTYLPLSKLALSAAGNNRVKINGQDDSVRVYAGLKLRGPLSVSQVIAGAEIAVNAPLRVTGGTTQAPHPLLADGPLTVSGPSSLNGNVTIGKPTAGATLTVNGATTLTSSLSINQAAADANGGDLYLGPTTESSLRLGHHSDYSWVQSYGLKPLAINPLGNNVGIGTTSPSTRLEIQAATDSGGNASLRDPEAVLTLYRPGIAGQTWPNIAKFSLSRYPASGTSGVGVAAAAGTPARTRLDLNLADGNSTDVTNIMTWRSDGNVGIGTALPQAKLDVQGRILRNGRDFSAAGVANHTASVSVPWGTRDDWNIFVSPQTVGRSEGRNDWDNDNAMLIVQCYAQEVKTDTKSWQIVAQCYYKWGNESYQWWPGSANYILIPK